MTRLKWVLSGTAAGVLFSALVHAALAGSIYYGFAVHNTRPIVADLDLSMTPLSPMAPNAGGGYAKPSETWTAPKKGKPPVPVLAPAQTTPEEVSKQDEAVPCAEPCTATGNDTGGGGSGEGEGQYISAEQASRKPRWVRNFITASDYPQVARQQGRDGRVVLLVLIDTDGKVRDARLLEGSYEALNEVALRKVKQAVFSPAYREDGKAVSCKVSLPIRFQLQ